MLTLLLACAVPTENDSVVAGAHEAREYACGWDATDPGTLEATGNQIGDVVSDWTAQDQCGEDVHLWDGHGRVTLVMAPPFW